MEKSMIPFKLDRAKMWCLHQIQVNTFPTNPRELVPQVTFRLCCIDCWASSAKQLLVHGPQNDLLHGQAFINEQTMNSAFKQLCVALLVQY